MKIPALTDMTLREKVAQCICVRQYDLIQKTEVDELIPRTDEERDELIKKNPYGTIWCMGHQKLKNVNMSEKNYGNIKVKSSEYHEWVQSVAKNYDIPPLMATDAESQGAGNLFEDLSITCGGLSVGAANSEKLSFELGGAISRELLCAGVNWRWAPVVDVVSRFSYSIMRSFDHDDIDNLIRLSVEHIKCMQSEGVAATAKHFPGGDPYEYRDSHFTTTELSSSMEEWWETQGRIFQEVFDGGVYSVMVGHHAFPAADDTEVNGKIIPATLSKKIITDLLKGEMKFDGVVITDAVGMAGLNGFYDYEDLLIKLIEAGNDILLGASIDSIDILEKAVLEGRLSKKRIDDACRRVLNMKEKLGLFEYGKAEHYSEIEVPKTAEITKQISEKSITLIRDRKSILPFNKNNIKRVTVICSTHDESFFDNLSIMKNEFENHGAEVKIQRRLESKEELERIAHECDLIIYAAYLSMHRPKGAPSFYGNECDTFIHAFSIANEKSIGVSMGYPYIFYDFMGSADICVNTYVDSPEVMRAFVKAVYGELPMSNSSPVNLHPDIRNHY